jgi:hypothetical protein
MNRRAFVTGLGGVLALVITAAAQQAGKVYRVAFLDDANATSTTCTRWSILNGLLM